LTHVPRIKAPANTCDVHMHVIYPEDKLPFSPENKGRFPPFTAENYMKVAKNLGIGRAVVVVTPAYGTDNRCVFQAMQDLALPTRGVIALSADAPDDMFRDAKAAGIVGLSTFMLGGRGVIDWPELSGLAVRASEFGMHIDLQMNGHELPERFDLLKNLPCDLVIDHIGKFLNPPTAVDDPAVRCLFDLLDTGNTYVKLSAAGETSNDRPPYMNDSGRIAQALARRFEDRLFWASNWPHLGDPDPARKPDNADLLDCLLTWAADDKIQHKILVTNPGRFYFGDPA